MAGAGGHLTRKALITGGLVVFLLLLYAGWMLWNDGGAPNQTSNPGFQGSFSSGGAEGDGTTFALTVPKDANCTDCHGSAQEIAALTASYETPEGIVVNPHKTVDRSASGSKSPHLSAEGELIKCTVCHSQTHSLPVSAGKVKQADVSYCFRACHHQKNFSPCSNCHHD